MEGNLKMSRESYIRSRLVEATIDARVAFMVWDYETVLAASKTLSAISDQMRRMKRPESVGAIDDDNLVECLPPSEPQGDEDIDGGLKVESSIPEPLLPPGGATSQEALIAALEQV